MPPTLSEAVTKVNMRFVEIKTPDQHACLMLHRTRHLFICEQTGVISAIRAHTVEFGIIARVGPQWRCGPARGGRGSPRDLSNHVVAYLIGENRAPAV